VIKDSVKKTPDYEKYKQEYTDVWNFYSQKIKEWKAEKDALDVNRFYRKDGPRPHHIETERNHKLKEVKEKYKHLFE